MLKFVTLLFGGVRHTICGGIAYLASKDIKIPTDLIKHWMYSCVIKFTRTRYSSKNAPINDELVQCSIFRVYTNDSLYPTEPKFTDLTYSVHQEPSRKKMDSI